MSDITKVREKTQLTLNELKSQLIKQYPELETELDTMIEQSIARIALTEKKMLNIIKTVGTRLTKLVEDIIEQFEIAETFVDMENFTEKLVMVEQVKLDLIKKHPYIQQDLHQILAKFDATIYNINRNISEIKDKIKLFIEAVSNVNEQFKQLRTSIDLEYINQQASLLDKLKSDLVQQCPNAEKYLAQLLNKFNKETEQVKYDILNGIKEVRHQFSVALEDKLNEFNRSSTIYDIKDIKELEPELDQLRLRLIEQYPNAKKEMDQMLLEFNNKKEQNNLGLAKLIADIEKFKKMVRDNLQTLSVTADITNKYDEYMLTLNYRVMNLLREYPRYPELRNILQDILETFKKKRFNIFRNKLTVHTPEETLFLKADMQPAIITLEDLGKLNLSAGPLKPLISSSLQVRQQINREQVSRAIVLMKLKNGEIDSNLKGKLTSWIASASIEDREYIRNIAKAQDKIDRTNYRLKYLDEIISNKPVVSRLLRSGVRRR